ncbi:AAA family ATPase [Amycolatopsis nigrescens]|uniref:AAA family ATPase n=1 Tax=Amycolatopsis nigrescens TaxID=381445 RepID=UPI00036815E1
MAGTEIEREQDYLTMLYEHLDALRREAVDRLDRLAALSARTGGDGTLDRDLARTWQVGEVARLDAVEEGLCFGRLDEQDGTRVYIGRTGLFRDDEDDPLLLDWRAPAARPFYTATAAVPQGVRRRRRITTRGRRVVALDDEVLDPAGADEDGLIGEAALLAAVTAGRTGRMRDIVSTLQAEQDRIVRSEHPGVLVVQGGPGTGKTAVALHRVAYLLYTHRHLGARGVLVVGPSRIFLDYIGQVLPGLGENSVVTATIADLYPGVRDVTADRAEAPETVELKGRASMATVLATAVQDRVTIPDAPVEVEFEQQPLRLDPADCHRAARSARRAGLPYNQARLVFHRELVGVLVRRLVERLESVVLTDTGEPIDGGDPGGALGAADLRALEAAGFIVHPDDLGPRDLLDEADVANLRDALLTDAGVQAALDDWWPPLTPQRLLNELYADPAQVTGLTGAQQRLLRREPGGWSPADVPLLDEAAALLGHRDAGNTAGGTIADRAAADRTWTFGHVVVDEAQELSEMAWRLLMRRCPSRSMTVVGDLAQTGDPAGTSSWDRVLGPHVDDRWRLVPLTVNYRTPAEIMAATTDLLAAHHPGMSPPHSVRSTGVPPWRLRTTTAGLPAATAEFAAKEAAALSTGRLAIIAPRAQIATLAAVLRAQFPELSHGTNPAPESKVVLLTAEQAKGLEFDSVLIADPAAILTGSARGHNDLYVAMTRTTHRLGILHPGPPPAELVTVAEVHQP